ncbi:hypothetical protein CJD36_019125 [Flavipsychrobacter stenotrophus]|uniref:DUF3347 domain-containing protein n=1 Tax=Flavipsychrobacter stenotrophus TaxID=2077091 RepID=A0A2S7SR28_9BACT|nr:DUF3347 domain-containing protein [Flavipsychrobacter stenotrophus]PQJ09362.1 hypothetical protein CJD36_019125 [Flavipsychrobacter stenotrophus]
MKKIITVFSIIIIANTSCNTGNTEENAGDKQRVDTTAPPPSNHTATTAKASIKGITDGYLHLKNALATDNSKDAATAGKEILTAMYNIDTVVMDAAQRKTYMAISDDLKENAEHIGANSGKIEHQREHFGMLSTDLYDLIKTFGTDKPLFKDYCPMAFDKKGAIWISEVKEIKNPYFGSEMSKCGEIKEELK